MSSRVAIVLAGGRGTRLGPLTDRTPKPLLAVGGRPFIEWSLATLAETGVSRIVVSCGYQAEALVSHFKMPRSDGLIITVVTESSPLGTGGAIPFAAQSVPDADPLLIANGDSCIAWGLASIWENLDAESDGVIAATRVADSARFGTLVISDDNLLSEIRQNVAGPGLINGGIYLLRRRVIDRFPAARPLSFEGDVLTRLVREGVRLRVLGLDAPFIDIGTRASYEQAETFVGSYLQHRVSR
jgi:D-glycero-alpha-D-manno-heptose 1-phosphate guanylyltransferase